jgi:hypothetical protein
MKAVLGVFSKLVIGVFAVVVVVFTSSMTLSVAERLIPSNVGMQWMSLFLFDGAAVVWYAQFLYNARGRYQRALSAAGFFAALVGVITMTAGELLLGQNLVILDDPESLGWILVGCVIIVAVVHVVLLYLYHAAEPSVFESIENEEATEAMVSASYAKARAELDADASVIASALTESIKAEILSRVGARIGVVLTSCPPRQVIDVRAHPAFPAPSPKVSPVGGKVSPVGGVGGGVPRPRSLSPAPVGGDDDNSEIDADVEGLAMAPSPLRIGESGNGHNGHKNPTRGLPPVGGDPK